MKSVDSIYRPSQVSAGRRGTWATPRTGILTHIVILRHIYGTSSFLLRNLPSVSPYQYHRLLSVCGLRSAIGGAP